MTDFGRFGERIAQERREKAARDRRDIGQKEVATAIGASASAVSRWENGEGLPDDEDKFLRLAEFFGVRPGWLRYGEGERAAPSPPAEIHVEAGEESDDQPTPEREPAQKGVTAARVAGVRGRRGR